MAEVKPKLPLDARVRVAKLREVSPELAEIAERMFPSEARDRAVREQRERAKRALSREQHLPDEDEDTDP